MSNTSKVITIQREIRNLDLDLEKKITHYFSISHLLNHVASRTFHQGYFCVISALKPEQCQSGIQEWNQWPSPPSITPTELGTARHWMFHLQRPTVSAGNSVRRALEFLSQHFSKWKRADAVLCFHFSNGDESNHSGWFHKSDTPLRPFPSETFSYFIAKGGQEWRHCIVNAGCG